MKYDYYYILLSIGIIAGVSPDLFMLLPQQKWGAWAIIILAVTFILFRYVNFIVIDEDKIILSRLMHRKEALHYQDIDHVIIKRGACLYNDTIKMRIVLKDRSIRIHFGNISFTETDRIAGMLEDKIRVVVKM